MKYFLCLFLFLCPSMLRGMGVEMQNQMLDSQIDKLTRERDEKKLDLQKCREQLQGYKIAGTTTLVATGVGLYANIKLNEKIKKMAVNEASSGMPTDNRSQEQKNCDSCALFVQAGVSPLPDECAGCS